MLAVIENLSVDLNGGMLFVNVIRDHPAQAGAYSQALSLQCLHKGLLKR